MRHKRLIGARGDARELRQKPRKALAIEVVTAIAIPVVAAERVDDKFSKADFTFDRERNVYICPADTFAGGRPPGVNKERPTSFLLIGR